MLLWFAMLGYRDLIEPDEGRYAEIPREMVASGDWVTPRLNDFKYFEKPALQYWMTAFSFQLFGQSNATARLWTATIGFLCGLFVWYLGRYLFGEIAGYYAFMLTMSSLLFVAMGHILTLDMSVSAFMVMGIGALAIAQSRRDRPRHVRKWMLLGWTGLGLAVLSKGLIGLVLPGGAVVIYSLWQRDWQLWRHLHLFKGLMVLLAITAPWFTIVSMRNREFAEFFFIHEHFQRYTTTVHHRTAPFYYYVPILMLGISPWLISGAKALLRPSFSWKPQNQGFNAERLLWVFVIFTLVFFSFGKSKLPAYILPVVPIIAVLAGKRLAKDGQQLVADGRFTLVLAGVLGIIAIFIPYVGKKAIPVELLAHYRWWLAVGAVVLSMGGWVLVKNTAKPFYGLTIACLLFLLGYQLYLWGFQEIAPSYSSREMADAIKSMGLEKTPIFSVHTYPQSLPFYLGKTIRLVQAKGELKMGIRAEPEKWISNKEAFAKAWRNQQQAIAIFRPKTFEIYKEAELPMNIIYYGPRYIAVSRK